MAIPVIPLVIVGVGLVVFGRRKRKPKKRGDAEPEAPAIPIKTLVFLPPTEPQAPTGPSGQPGQPCKADDGAGAWDELGACKTFWIEGDTDEAIRRLAREEWEARGRPSFSKMCLMVPDPTGGELAPPKANPIFVEIVAAALQRYYDVGPLFPPKVALQFDDPVSPYWVQEAWARAQAVVQQELCGG
jgi:hypothetical protein